MRRTFLCNGHGQKNSIISIKRFDIVLKKHIAGVRITNLFAVLSRKFSTAARHSIHTLQFLVLLLLLFLSVFITVVFFGQRCDSLSAACLCVCVYYAVTLLVKLCAITGADQMRTNYFEQNSSY